MTTQDSGRDPRQGRFIQRLREHPVRNYRWRRRDFDQQVAEHPDLVVQEETSVLMARPLGDRFLLYYGFDDLDVMRRRLEPLLEHLIAQMGRAESAPEFWLQFEDRPHLHWLEPALKSVGFEALGEWVRVNCPELPAPETPEPPMPQGATLRAATEADLEALSAIDAGSFAPWVLGQAALKQLIATTDTFAVVEQEGTIVGLTCLMTDRSGLGRVELLAVHPERRRQGLGRALLTWSLWRLGQSEMVEAEALIGVDNLTAINLYRSVGFTPPREGGITYRRPAGWQKAEPVYRYKPVEEVKVQPFFWIKPRWD